MGGRKNPSAPADANFTVASPPSASMPAHQLKEFDAMISLNVNGELRELDDDPETPLLWVIRESLGLTGTKFGCGIAQCGACTVHLNGQPVRACVIPLAAAAGQSVTTIEGLAPGSASADPVQALHPVQQAWVEAQVPQCGYCQSGQIMSAAALLRDNPDPDDAAIDAAMRGNLCRCGTYPRIRSAIHRAAELARAIDFHEPAAPVAGQEPAPAAAQATGTGDRA